MIFFKLNLLNTFLFFPSEILPDINKRKFMTKGNKHDTQLACRIPLRVQFCMSPGYLLPLLLLGC